jgi:hypothetical protein
MKSGNLNFLEPSGPLQACNGTALHLPYVTFSLTLKEEHMQTMFKKSMLQNILALQGRSNRRLRKLNDEEPHNLYPSSNVIRLITSKIKIGEAYSTQGGEEKFIIILVGNRQGKRLLRRPTQRFYFIVF